MDTCLPFQRRRLAISQFTEEVCCIDPHIDALIKQIAYFLLFNQLICLVHAGSTS